MKKLLKNLVDRKIGITFLTAITIMLIYIYFDYKMTAKKLVINIPNNYNGYVVIFFNQKNSNVKNEFRFPYHYIHAPSNGIIKTSLLQASTLKIDIKVNNNIIHNYSLNLKDKNIKPSQFGIYISQFSGQENNTLSTSIEGYYIVLISRKQTLDSVRYPDTFLINSLYKNEKTGVLSNWIMNE